MNPHDDAVGKLRKHGSTRICDLTRLPGVPENTPANKAQGGTTKREPHARGRKLRGTAEIMDMRTRSAQFSKGRIPLENQGRKGERIHFLFCILYHSRNSIPSCIHYPLEFPREGSFGTFPNFESAIIIDRKRKREGREGADTDVKIASALLIEVDGFSSFTRLFMRNICA